MKEEVKARKLGERRKEIELLVKAKEESRVLLMSKSNVIGIGVGYRKRNGKVTDELVMKVYVSRKLKKDMLSKTDLVPPTIEFDKNRIGTDVEERKIPEAQVFTLRSRPLIGGSSIGPAGSRGSGTLGICVTLDDDETYILSNNHVLAEVNQQRWGADIVQPSEADGGSAASDIIADLVVIPGIDFGTHTVHISGVPVTLPNPNHVDCALAQVRRPSPPDPGSSFNNANREIHWVGYPAFLTKNLEDLKLWEIIEMYARPVHKMGRTTEYTVGRVVDAAWDGFVDYSKIFGNPRNTNLAWFENQLEIEGYYGKPFSLPGDSGSLVLDALSNQPVGLLFAGNGIQSVANHIAPVMKVLCIKRI